MKEETISEKTLSCEELDPSQFKYNTEPEEE
jgi:hypothetical protein